MGYSIDQLKKTGTLEGNDTIPVMQGGLTKQVAAGILNNAKIITAAGSQASGIIRREMTYILKNNSSAINFTLNNAVGKKVVNNDYSDDAATATGWIIKVMNVSTRSHVVIVGSNSWDIAKNENMYFFWTGSAWTLHNARMNNVIVDGDLKLPNAAAVSSLAGTSKLAGLDANGKVNYTTPDAIKDTLGLATTTEMADVYKKIGEFGNTATNPEHYYKISGFKNISNNNTSDMATIIIQTRYTARLRITAIAYHTAVSYVVRADLENDNFPPTFDYQVKYDISSGIFNIYVKAISGVTGTVYANRQLFFLENRTNGANELTVTEVTESDFNNAQYNCTINKVVKDTDLGNYVKKFPCYSTGNASSYQHYEITFNYLYSGNSIIFYGRLGVCVLVNMTGGDGQQMERVFANHLTNPISDYKNAVRIAWKNNGSRKIDFYIKSLGHAGNLRSFANLTPMNTNIQYIGEVTTLPEDVTNVTIENY